VAYAVHLQFSFQAASPETFGYTLVNQFRTEVQTLPAVAVSFLLRY